MQTLHVNKRLTHEYANGWSLLDETVPLAVLKVTPLVKVKEADGYDDGGVGIQYARIPPKVKFDELAQAIDDTIGGSNCIHEHDCCGCAVRIVETKRIGRNIQIKTSVRYNY